MEIKNLCKAYGDLPVLENVSFTAGVGVTALWGPSGVGKTTLLRILLGLEKPDSGELMGMAVRWSAVFQEDRLLEGLDALGNLRFALGTDYEEAKAAAHSPKALPGMQTTFCSSSRRLQNSTLLRPKLLMSAKT